MRTYLTLFARPENAFWPCLYVGAHGKADVTRWLSGAQFWAGWTPSVYLAEPLTPFDIALNEAAALVSFNERAQKVVRAMQELARRAQQKVITVEAPPTIDEAAGAKRSLRLTREA